MTSVFVKKSNEQLSCAQRPLSITSLWGGNKDQNPADTNKKVNFKVHVAILSINFKIQTFPLVLASQAVRYYSFVPLISGFFVFMNFLNTSGWIPVNLFTFYSFLPYDLLPPR